MSEGRWADAMRAVALFAVDPAGLGISLRVLPGPVRDRFLTTLNAIQPPGNKPRRIPLHISDDRLLGGLNLPATLRAGRPVAARGVLAEADGGMVLLAMAERIPAATAARLCAVLDNGEVVAERDGMALRGRASIGVVALDEGIEPDERPAAALLDRLAFLIDLTGASLSDADPAAFVACDVPSARARLVSVTMPDEILAAICGAASSLGVGSMRAHFLAVHAARAAASLAGREVVTADDAAVAARLVLAPRATIVSVDSSEPLPDQPQEDAPLPGESDDSASSENGNTRNDAAEARDLGEILLQAAKSSIPAGLLAQLLASNAARAVAEGRAGAGAPRQSTRRGRPIGVRAGALRSGTRLNLVETLRAAAPWQKLRQRAPTAGAAARIIVVPDDFRIVRFRRRSETTTIFVVDASGSTALNRLAEVKGAVELVLADCYVRRDRVALIAFRGIKAELLLPPTGSLVRAKRSLAALPGGGATPLAAGIDAALSLADAVRRRGQCPVVIFLSDGRANIARDGTPGRVRAEADALQAARMMRAASVACMLVDASPRPAASAGRLAAEMGARYLALPYADAEALSRAVRATPA